MVDDLTQFVEASREDWNSCIGVKVMNGLSRSGLKGRWKVAIALLIVLALIVGGVGACKLLEYMEWLSEKRAGEEWLRRECSYRKLGFWWNFSSISGFDLGYRGGERMLTLLLGEKGSIELVIKGDYWHLSKAIGQNLYKTCELSLYGTIDDSGSRVILPPGVRAEFTTSNVTLPAGGNVSVLQTINADPDAPTGCYYYGVGIKINSTYTRYFGADFWLVIGPYTPHGNFSLIEGTEDFIARDEINISRKVGAEIWMTTDIICRFDIRSEGSPLNVTLEVVNVDMPEGVKLSVPQQVFVPAGSRVFVDETIGPYANPEVGKTYHFKVICRSGNETHIANFNIIVYIP